MELFKSLAETLIVKLSTKLNSNELLTIAESILVNETIIGVIQYTESNTVKIYFRDIVLIINSSACNATCLYADKIPCNFKTIEEMLRYYLINKPWAVEKLMFHLI